MASISNTYTSSIYKADNGDWYFNSAIFTQATNDINSSSLLGNTKGDALTVLSQLSTYFNSNVAVNQSQDSGTIVVNAANGSIVWNTDDFGGPFNAGTGDVVIILNADDPSSPSVVLNIPKSTVNTGESYTVAANAATGGVSTLVAVVIEYYDGSTWIEYAADSGSLGTNHTNNGLPIVSTSTGGDTTVQWRAWAEDNYGQIVETSPQNINVNALPSIVFLPYAGFPPTTVYKGSGSSYTVYAQGADPDQASWGRLEEVHIDVNINGTGWQQFAAAPRGTGSWPVVFNSCSVLGVFDNLGTTQFRAWSNDANSAHSGYIYWTVQVVNAPTPTPTPTATPTPTPTISPTPPPTVYTVQVLNSNGGLKAGFNGNYSGDSIYNVLPGNYVLDAEAVPGYVFSYWRVVTGSGAISDIYNQTTSVLINNSVQIMAMFGQDISTPTPTATPTVTPTPTPTATPTITPSPTPTSTPTSTPTVTPTPTPTITGAPTFTPTPTVTPTITPTPTVTPTLIPAQLSVYTPWVVAQTNTPVWIESIYPISKFVTSYKILWSANGALSATYIANGFGENFLLYTYLSAAPGNSYYSVNANSLGQYTVVPRTLLNRLYIKDALPTYNIDNYFDPVTQTPTLPYSLSEVLVGSNEWVVSDVINSSFSKLTDNFNYLKNISQVLKLNNELSLIEWTAQLCHDSSSINTSNASAFAWKTNIDGLNWDNSFQSISATGVADGNIKDFKSYRFTNITAPDYYNYIAYGSSGNIPDHIQIRTNDWRHTIVLSATSLGDNIPNFACVSAIDVLNNQLYLLDTDTVYRAGVSILPPPQGNDNSLINSKLLAISQVGGVSGTRTFNTGFNVPTEIKAHNDLVYVCDSLNSCVKVYNTALSWVKTLYVDTLSAYSAERIEINRANESVFVLGKTFAPVPPVVTSLNMEGVIGNTTIYRITFDHDGLRLKDNTTNVLSAFALYGLLSGGQSYSLLTSAVMLSATYSAPLTVTYLAASGAKYTDFKVQALGNNGFNSELSNSQPTPNNYYFKSPYKVFEINSNSKLVNSFELPNNLTHVEASQNIKSDTVIKKIVIDPTGVFLYFITNSNVYKYLTDGTALNRLTDPSKSSLGSVEDITTGFIDDRLNFYVVTNKRVFKYVDIPDTLDLFDTDTVDSLILPLSAISINREEFVQDWVYNKSIMRLLQNHEILYKAIKYKYKINLDRYGNLVSPSVGDYGFTITGLSGVDLTKSFSVSQDNYVHSNELVTSSVINRALTELYNLQLNMLQLVSPRINRTLPQPNNDLP